MLISSILQLIRFCVIIAIFGATFYWDTVSYSVPTAHATLTGRARHYLDATAGQV